MAFKFTLLGIEFSRDNQMAHKSKSIRRSSSSKRKSKKQSSQQKKFGRAVTKCHNSTKTLKTFGECMSKRLKK